MVRCPRCGFTIPDGETECIFCRSDVSRVKNRPQQVREQSHQIPAIEHAKESRQEEIGYAGFWKRFGAGFLDLGIFAVLAAGAKTACDLLQYPGLAVPAMVATGIFYFLVITPLLTSSRYRGSPGKIIAGIVATDMNGRPLTFSHALARELGKYVSLLTGGIGFFLAGVTKKKQELHDLLVLTVVTERSQVHRHQYLAPANPLVSRRRLLFGTTVILLCILGSVLVALYFGVVLHKSVTPQGLAAHGILVAADTVADTKYPEYALPLYDTAIDLQPEDTGILVKKVHILGEEGRMGEAQACLNRAMIANPNDTVPVILTGDLLYGSGQYQSSIRYYEKALGMNRENANVWIKKGDAYLALSIVEMQGIRDQYRTLTAKNSDPYGSSDASTMDAFRSTESYREAIKAYNEAIRIDPFTSVEISGRVLASTQVLLGTYQGILDDIGIDNSTINRSTTQKTVM